MPRRSEIERRLRIKIKRLQRDKNFRKEIWAEMPKKMTEEDAKIYIQRVADEAKEKICQAIKDVDMNGKREKSSEN